MALALPAPLLLLQLVVVMTQVCIFVEGAEYHIYFDFPQTTLHSSRRKVFEFWHGRKPAAAADAEEKVSVQRPVHTRAYVYFVR